jgi:hypothetical protein
MYHIHIYTSSFLLDRMSQLIMLHPRFGQEFDNAMNEEKLDKIPNRRFQTSKERLIMIDICLKQQKNMEAHERDTLVKMILEQGHVPTKDRSTKSIFALASAYFKSKPSVEENLSEHAHAFSSTTDTQFLSQLREIRSREPRLETEVATVFDLAHKHFQALIKKRLKSLFGKFQHLQEQDCTTQILNLAASQREERQRASRRFLVQEMQETTADMS